MAEEQSVHLNIHRIKDGITDHDEILPDRGKCDFESVRLSDGTLALVYYASSSLHAPRWASFFDGVVDAKELRSAYSSAVLLVQRQERVYALTFGYGYAMLAPGVVETRFGLHAVLNSIDPSSIRSIDHKTVEVVSRLTREQLSAGADLSDYGLDVERDLLRAVTGVPLDEVLGLRMSGRDSLSVNVHTSLADVGQLLDRYEAVARDETYKDQFPFVDNISEVKDPAIVDGLDHALLLELNRGAPTAVYLTAPEIVDWTHVAGFSFRGAQSARLFDDLLLGGYFEDCREPGHIGLDDIRKRDRVRVVPPDDGKGPTWSLYRCLVAELEMNEATYILHEGQWFQVSNAFLAEVDGAVDALPECDVALPAFADDDESAYNRRVADGSAGQIFCLDQVWITPHGWRDRVEFCDLLERNWRMIHVKRYKSSKSLSHLFSQGGVSAQLLLSDVAFRQDLNAKVPHAFRLADPRLGINAGDFQVAFAVIQPPGRAPSLPFFSRVNLRNTAALLGQFGFEVSLTHIPSQEAG